MRRTARLLSYGGAAVAVFALSFLHASSVAQPTYDFVGPWRIGWAGGYSLLLVIATYAVGLPDQPNGIRQASFAAIAASAIAALGISVPQLLLGDALLPRFVVFGSAVVLVPWQVLLNLASRDSRLRDEDRDRVLLVGRRGEEQQLRSDLELDPDLEREARLIATISVEDASAETTTASVDGVAVERPLIRRVQDENATVVVLDRLAQADDRIIAQVASLHEAGLRIRTLSDFYEEWLGKLPLSELERASLFFDIGELHRVRYGRLKRIMDIVFALVGAIALVVATPLVLVGNLVANRGPLLYRQARVGKGGEPFTILKFRTMGNGPMPGGGADDNAGEWTAEGDPRITSFGGLLRRTHLDELPQVVNILRGELSVVGPRPEQPHYVEELRSKLAFYDMRHLVRPGLTGWAQVKYGYAGDERDALEKLQYEFFYLRHQDLRFDQRIVVRTIRSVAGGNGRGR